MLYVSVEKFKKMLDLSKVNSGKHPTALCSSYVDTINSAIELSYHLGRLYFTTVHLGQFYEASLKLSVECEGGEDFPSTFLNLQKCQLMAGTLNQTGDISLEFEEGQLLFSDGKREAKCPASINLESIPCIEALPIKASKHVFYVDRFKDMLSKVSHAIAPRDEVRPVLRSVNVKIVKDLLSVCAADGHRLATDSMTLCLKPEKFEEYAEEEDKKIITKSEVELNIPELTVRKLLKILDGLCILRAQTEHDIPAVEFEIFSDDYRGIFYSTLVEGTFPKYKGLIPSNPLYSIAIPQKDCVTLLKQHSKFLKALRKIEGSEAEEAEFNSKLLIALNSLNIATGCVDYGEVVADITLVDSNYQLEQPFRLVIVTEYLLEACREVSGAYINFHFTGPLDPVKITDDESYTEVLMPIREKERG